MGGDIDEFYIADAFGSRKEAYGRRGGGASSSVENFNQIFIDVMADQKKGKKGSTPVKKHSCWTRTSRSGSRSTPRNVSPSSRTSTSPSTASRRSARSTRAASTPLYWTTSP